MADGGRGLQLDAMRATTRMTPGPGRLLPLIVAGALAVASPGPADAQSGTITYTRVTTVEVDVPGEMAEVRSRLAEARERSFLLHFNPAASLMVPAPEDEGQESPPAVFPMTHANLDAVVEMFESIAASQENAVTRAYSGSGGAAAFRVLEGFEEVLRTDAPPSIDWELTDERRTHAGYRVTRATGWLDGGEIVAWFAPDIPVQAGPALYGGLPGMILVLSLNGGSTIYGATAVSLDGAEGEIVPPADEGRVVSPEEYRSFVSDKIGDMRRSFRRMRNQGRHLDDCALGGKAGRMSLSCFDRGGP